MCQPAHVVLLPVLTTLLLAQTPLENTGKPLHVQFECTEADTQAAGLSCSDEEPCPVYLELANVEAVGNKLFLPGNLHTATTTISSILLATEDAGKTWIEAHPRIRLAGLDQIQFFDFQNGWISGASLQSVPRDPFFLLTTDGGKTWRQRPIYDETRVATIERFWFESAQKGSMLVDARLEKNRHELYDSRTGGESWSLPPGQLRSSTMPRGRDAGPAAWRTAPTPPPTAMRSRSRKGNAGKRSPASWSTWGHANSEAPILSSWNCSGTCWFRSPKRWAWCCARPPTRPTSRSAAIIPARFTTRAAKPSPWAITCPCIWARCRFRCGTRCEAFELAAGRRRHGQRSVSRRHASAGHHRGLRCFVEGAKPAGVLRGQPRASRRRRRHEPGIDAAGARDLSGRHPHSAGAAGRAAARSTGICCV